MKRIIFVCTVVISAILIGCQDTSPVGPESAAKPVTGLKVTVPSWIPLTLSGVIQIGTDKGGTAKLGIISGTSRYSVTYPTKDQVKVSFLMDCTLKPITGIEGAWSFSGTSDDIIKISPSGTPTFLIKQYTTGHIGEAMVLYVKYMVVEGVASVESMWATELPWVSGS